MKPVINKRKCPATKDWCKAIPACPKGVIYHVLDASEPMGGKIMIDEIKCDGCGICVDECCGQAIDMIEKDSHYPGRVDLELEINPASDKKMKILTRVITCL